MEYADDIIIAMKETYKEIKTLAKTTGLEVNVNKTKAAPWPRHSSGG
jgi:hypothetical protein